MIETLQRINFGKHTHGANSLLAVACLALAACGSLPSISADADYFCRPAVERIHTFRVEFEDVPEFLKPMLRDSASVVLDSKDIEYTEGDADSVLKMRFLDTSVSDNEAARDEAWETIAPGGGARFIAEIKVELSNSVTRETILTGSMRRLHNVYEGSYMHDAPARAAMKVAFEEIFADCPVPSIEDY